MAARIAATSLATPRANEAIRLVLVDVVECQGIGDEVDHCSRTNVFEQLLSLFEVDAGVMKRLVLERDGDQFAPSPEMPQLTSHMASCRLIGAEASHAARPTTSSGLDRFAPGSAPARDRQQGPC